VDGKSLPSQIPVPLSRLPATVQLQQLCEPQTPRQTEGQERAGYGVTWFEVLRITLLGGAFGLGKVFAEEVAKKTADVVVEWARERFKGRKSKSKRPVYLAILGPDGLLKSLVIKECNRHARRPHRARLETCLRS
jgi:hypothetical protein